MEEVRKKYNLLENKTACLMYIGQKVGKGLSTMQHYMYDRPIPEDLIDIIHSEIDGWLEIEIEAKKKLILNN